MSKRLGGIIGCKYKTSSWHLNFVVVVVFTLKTVLTSIQYILFLTLQGKETNSRGHKLTQNKVQKNKIKRPRESPNTTCEKICKREVPKNNKFRKTRRSLGQEKKVDHAN